MQPVLVLHAWWGLNATFKEVCNRLATVGYLAFAPDLHHGKIATTIDEAEALVQPIFGSADGMARVRAEVAAAAEWLHERSGQPLAVIGFSMGAFFALDASVTLPDTVHKVVTFYGTHPGEAADFASAKAACLGHFAETDDFEPGEAVNALEANLKAAGRPVTFHTYPGTGHWFFEPDRPDAYNAEAAALAWERTLAFLK
jgi:carboxymethylenebutenolidase